MGTGSNFKFHWSKISVKPDYHWGATAVRSVFFSAHQKWPSHSVFGMVLELRTCSCASSVKRVQMLCTSSNSLCPAVARKYYTTRRNGNLLFPTPTALPTGKHTRRTHTHNQVLETICKCAGVLFCRIEIHNSSHTGICKRLFWLSIKKKKILPLQPRCNLTSTVISVRFMIFWGGDISGWKDLYACTHEKMSMTWVNMATGLLGFQLWNLAHPFCQAPI